ncbi:hypothetical protein Tco_1177325 [Tanacetum coccineum]
MADSAFPDRLPALPHLAMYLFYLTNYLDKEDQGIDFKDDDKVKEWEDDEDWLMTPVTPPRAVTHVRPDTPLLSFAASTPLPIDPIMIPNYQTTTTSDFLTWIPPTLHRFQHSTYEVGGPSLAAPEAPALVGRPLSMVASRVALHH